MSLTNRLANLLLLGISSALALALGEVALRRLAPQPLDAAYVWPDGTLRHLPSFCYTYTRQEFSNAVSYNALGLRGREVSPTPAPGTLRLAFLGDSFVEGKQVGEDEVFTSRLEQLAAESGRELEIINGGVGGYGTSDELLLWERVIAPLRPHLVLVGFFPNDVRNNLERGWFELRAGRVLQVREPPRPRVRWLYETQKSLVARLHLAYLLKSALLGAEAPDPRRGTLVEDEEVFAIRPSARIERGWALTLALLAELKRRVAAAGGRFAVVVFPTRFQVDAALWRAQAGRLGLDPAAFELEAPQRRLGEWAEREDVQLIELLADFRAANQQNSFYYRIDAHWNATGHRLAAGVLWRELLGRGLLDRFAAAPAAASPATSPGVAP